MRSDGIRRRHRTPSASTDTQAAPQARTQLQDAYGNKAVSASLGLASGGGGALAGPLSRWVARDAEANGTLEDERSSNQAMLRLMRQHQGETEVDAAAALPQGAGRPLPQETRERMEAAFGHDFGHVRVHDDGQSGRAAAGLGAHAAAMGSHIYFGQGEWAPGTPAGDRLLVHELTHVVQHDEGRLPTGGGVSSPEDAHEREAYANEARSLDNLSGADATVGVSRTAKAVSRSADATLSLRKRRSDMSEDERTRDDADKEAFRGMSFSEANHMPAAAGKFDIAYTSATGQLKVTVKLAFVFHNFEHPALPPARRLVWTADQRAAYIATFKANVLSTWSGQFTLRCTRQGWEAFQATPAISVEAVEGEGGGAHFTVDVRHPEENVPGEFNDSHVNTKKGTARLSESDFSNTGHGKATDIIAAERTRIAGAIGGAAQVTFPKDGTMPDAAGQSALKAFGDALGRTNPSAPKFRITVAGDAVATEGKAELLAERRSENAGNYLTGRGNGYPVSISHSVGGKSQARTTMAAEPQDIVRLVPDDTGDGTFIWSGNNYHFVYGQRQEVTQFQNQHSVAMHEFGHMIGNADEYQPRPGDEAHANEVYNKWKADVENARAALPNDGVRGASTSIMASGGDVLPAHYAPIHRWLSGKTAPHVTADEWSIG